MAEKANTTIGHTCPIGGRVLAAVLAAPLLMAAATGPASAATVPAGPAGEEVRQCVPEDFKIIENERRAAAGTTYIEFAMLRIGGEGEANAPRQEPCSLYRELDVSWVDEHEGSIVGAWAVYDGEPGEPFVLEPEEDALLTLAQPNHGNYDPEVCGPTRVAGIRVGFHLGVDGSVYSPTGGDTVCANPEVAVPRYSVEPSGF